MNEQGQGRHWSRWRPKDPRSGFPPQTKPEHTYFPSCQIASKGPFPDVFTPHLHHKKRMACWRNPSQPRARADLLINIVRAGAEGNHELFRHALEALITEERSKQHHVLADLLLPAAIRQAFAPPNSNPATACFPSTTLSLHKGWCPAT